MWASERTIAPGKITTANPIASSSAAGSVGVGDSDPTWPEATGLLEERLPVAVRAEAKRLETVGQVVEDVEATRADRAGGAEHDNTAQDGFGKGRGAGAEVVGARHAPIIESSAAALEPTTRPAGRVTVPSRRR